MQAAYQTIVWGPRIDDIDRVLDVIAKAGYQGVEFGQRPDLICTLNGPIASDQLSAKLEQRNLSLVGFVAGSLEERMKFCADRLRPQYLYVDGWEPAGSANAIAAGFTLALHPHAFKTVHRVDQAVDLLRIHPELKWLADTAHLTITGNARPAAVLEVPG